MCLKRSKAAQYGEEAGKGTKRALIVLIFGVSYCLLMSLNATKCL
jgi:hypothetical protein